MPDPRDPVPRPRADAQRNRERLLAAAEHAFNTEGANAALDDIARAAGVGNATLYRHFPTRADLIGAVFDERIGALTTLAEHLRATQPAGTALLAWLRAVIDHITSSRGLREAFTDAHHLRLGDGSTQVSQWHRTTDAAAGPLLRDAQETGTARPDLRADELMALTAAVAHAADGDRAHAHRLLTLVTEGTMRLPNQPPT